MNPSPVSPSFAFVFLSQDAWIDSEEQTAAIEIRAMKVFPSQHFFQFLFMGYPPPSTKPFRKFCTRNNAFSFAYCPSPAFLARARRTFCQSQVKVKVSSGALLSRDVFFPGVFPPFRLSRQIHTAFSQSILQAFHERSDASRSC